MLKSNRRLCSLTLAALACAPLAAEDENSTTSEAAASDKTETVLVGGFAIEPFGHLASPDDALVIHPKALLGLGYDTNIFATQNDTKHSAFLDGIAGIDLRWMATSQDKLVLSGEYEGEDYFSQKGRNLSGGKVLASYRHTAEVWDAGGMASASRTNDPFIITGQEIKHDNYDVEIDGNRKVGENSGSLGATFDRLRYLEGAAGIFGKDDRNYDDYGVNARAGHEIGDDSEFYAKAMVDHRKYDQNVFDVPEIIPGTLITTTHGYNDSTGITGELGWKQKVGTRSGLIAEVGATWRHYSADFEADSNFKDQTTIYPAANILFRWNYEVGSWVGANAYSQTIDSVFSNAAWLYGLTVDTRYRLLADNKGALFGSASAYSIKDSGSPQTAIEPNDEVRNTFEIQAGGEYILHKGIGVRVKDVFDDSHSKYFNSFKRDVIEAEIGIVY